MPKLYSSKEILKVLENQGFLFASQKGSHIKYRKTGNRILTVIVPAGRKQIPKGTFSSILRQADLKAEDFEK
ncbi:MAG: type II toxin-antitoxin system HicA family toxin [Candidatus Doudnabacteria bacterium]|nr:type II toxin-antitoxin system HicA family toxin [Candidatus Doudnabacteria bacterium]